MWHRLSQQSAEAPFLGVVAANFSTGSDFHATAPVMTSPSTSNDQSLLKFWGANTLPPWCRWHVEISEPGLGDSICRAFKL